MGGFARKLWRGVKYAASALIFPIDLKFKDKVTGKWSFSAELKWLKFAIFTLTYYVMQPLLIFLFPTAESVLEKQGLDPNIIQNITPAKDIRVVPDNIGGKAYFLFSKPPLFNPVQFCRYAYCLFNPRVRGFQSDYKAGFLVWLISPGLKTVFLKSNAEYLDEANKDNKAGIEEASKGRYTYISMSNGRDYAQQALLHEIRHTSPGNDRLSPLFREADADYHAYQQLSLARRDTTLAQRMLSDNLMHGSDADHNTALYLHLKFNNRALPTEEEMRRANAEAKPVIDDYMALQAKTIAGKTEKADSLSKKFNAEVSRLSPLAALRVRLFQEALQQHIVPKNVTEKPVFPFKPVS